MVVITVGSFPTDPKGDGCANPSVLESRLNLTKLSLMDSKSLDFDSMISSLAVATSYL